MNEIVNIIADENNPVVAQPKQSPKQRKAPERQTPVQAKEVAEVDPREQRKRDLKAKIAAEREQKAKMVTGKFLFNECPGGELKFVYREFPDDPLVKYTMKHDSIHTIPLGVAMHLNDRCSYPEFSHNLDNGKTVNGEAMYATTLVHRTNFIPLDFTINAGSYGPSIVQITQGNPMNNQHSPIHMGR